MRPFRLRSDLRRAVIDGFALPLGLVPGDVAAPTQGYTVEYAPGEEDDPDSYAFHIVVSHERLTPILDRVFARLPRRVFPIVEIGSRDAYRSVDVYMAQEPIAREQFMRGWRRYGSILVEDGSIGVGANSEEPFLEVFLDQWKGLWMHVPLAARSRLEAMLESFGLREVPETWPEMDEQRSLRALRLRNVLTLKDEFSPDLDELLLQLRYDWDLGLNVDPETNIDEGGRELGPTLWHATVVVESVDDPDTGAYASIWATAASLAEMEELIHDALARYPAWRFTDLYTVDRVAYDERPEELTALPPRQRQSKVHLVAFDVWAAPSAGDDLRRSVGDHDW